MSAATLPQRPLPFILHFVRQKWPWFAGMFALETVNAVCGILVPTAISEIVRSVLHRAGNGDAKILGTAQPGALHWLDTSGLHDLRGPLWVFLGLCVGEVVFSRAAGTLQFYFGPVQRQSVTRTLYVYLQGHSQRYFSNNFAGALAHRISETAMGVNQLLWALIFDFWPVAIVLGVSVLVLFRTHT